MKNLNANHFKKHPIFIGFVILTFLIWSFGINDPLFLFLNAQHIFIPTNFLDLINTIASPSNGILLLILLLLTVCFRRDKLLNVIILIVGFYACFGALKLFFHIPRPYILHHPSEFFWIPPATLHAAKNSAMQSFPSGHAGSAGIFVFACIHLFAEHKKWLKVLLVLFLLLVMFTRIATGWHYPMDVLVAVLLSFVFTEICWRLPSIHQIRQKRAG